MSVGIVLPAFNVQETVADAIEEISRLHSELDVELIVVDNKSSDGTIETLKRIETSSRGSGFKWKLLERERNMGYGASIKAGFDYFLDGNVSHIMVLHSDGQTDNFVLGANLIRTAKTIGADAVLGCRFLSSSALGGYSKVRTVANHFFNWVTRMISGHEMSDAGTAMIIIKSECLREIEYSDMPSDWKFHPILNIALSASKEIEIAEIPMSWKDSKGGSSVPTVRYGFSLLGLLLAAGWRRATRKSPSWWLTESKRNEVRRIA